MERRHHVFSVDLLERYATKGRGAITCMATGNDVIVLGTNKGWVIRHDFGVGDSYDIDLSVGRPGEQSIHKVFVDPGGSHCIATVIGSSGAETYYTHAKWTKPRILSKLKGLVVNAVAWNRQHITEASTREIILGTDNGQLYEMAVDVKDKMEKYIKLLYELKELPEAFTGLQMETASVHNGTRFYVMAVTPTRLYSFTGIGSLDAIFASYVDRTVHFMELPGEIPNSELHFFIQQRRAVHFAWLSGAGIYHGDLKFGAQHSSPNGDENFVENKALLDYSKFSEGVEGVKPSSMAISEFHFLLLIGNKVKVVNRISEQIVEELYFDQTSDAVSRGIIGLCSDASAGLFYAYDQNSIFQVSVNDEGCDMWKVYLDLKEYAAALAISEFHFLLLIGNKVKVVNRISEQIVEELYFDQTSDAVSRGIIGLCSDASAGLFYAYDQNSIFQVSVNDEGCDMWKVYLDLKEYAAALAISEFHFLLLIGNKVKVVNRISEQIVEELYFDQTSDAVSRGIIGLCSDASAGLFYAYDQNSIFQVSVNDEGCDMWKVYLDLKEYAAALASCRDTLQRDQVYLVQAEAAFVAEEFLRAASFYAKINYVLSFEEISLKFISIGEQDALRTFLLRKLDNLSKDEKCQITMISTWATELYLDKINLLLLEDDGALDSNNTEYQSLIKEFRAFLSDCKDVLDEATTMKLLESYGRVDELVFFASLKEQYEIVLHHYIQQGEAKKALQVLQKPNVATELQYKFAPDLIMLDAYETVESWMTTKSLNPRKLIPAMMRYSSEPHAKNETHEVIKYLEYCVHRLQNEDPGVHNLLLSLYAKKEDESALLRFLECKFGKGQPGGPEFFYDPKYALRLCLKEKRMRACVHIYSMMSMHEEAVALALQVDPELAMAEADKVEDDEDLRKKLWLMIAKHVIEQEKGTKRENIRKAIAFLKETDGLLKIEDILPFFPDFALIDDFKEAICSSLEDYNEQIEKLKQEMNDATRGADNIRNDISALAQRYTVIDRDEECGVCRRKILNVGGDYRMTAGYMAVGPMAPFYVFPCGHAFHAQCLIAHVTRCTNQAQAEYILDLQKQLTLLGAEPKNVSNGGLSEEPLASVTPMHKIRSQLDDAVASDCPFCGDLMIREISLPFILPEDAEESESWEIQPHNHPSQRSLSLAV